MKNLILYAAIIAGITFVACSDDEDNVPLPTYVGCVTCEIPDTAPSEIEEMPYEVCVDTAGIAYVDNAYTGIEASYYFELYCANEFELPLPPTQWDNDTIGQCRSCSAYTVSIPGSSEEIEMPAQEVCKGENGNAIVDGIPSQMAYEQYLLGLDQFTDCN
jgi:hypothetical protein